MTNREKYKKAFDVLATSEHLSLEEDFNMNRKQKKSMTAAVVSAIVAVGSITVCAAAYMNWSSGLTEELRISEDQKVELEESGMATFSGVSATDAGITVTAQNCITDNYYTYLSFKVDGYELPPNSEPCFDSISISVDGNDQFSWVGSFYDGTVEGPDGLAVYADGTPIDFESDSFWGKYVQEDGSLEYHAVLSNSEEKGFFIGKQIKVTFENLGTTAKADFFPDVDGTWEMEWILGGKDISKEYQMQEKLGDTEAVVTHVELSPISINVLYQFPKMEYTETIQLEDGTTQECTFYEEAPMPDGLLLKDETLLPNIYGGPGSIGYINEETEEYQIAFALNQVIDPAEIKAILFRKSYPEGTEGSTIENFYVVELESLDGQ